ncbi:MAG: hypothetical protein V7K77_03485 [Nostoc sp.]|uniref:hypothetical protein n=1 Tax=Nostoc sp. TaxID=1180 RepID=UPI002FF48FA6
MSNDEYDSPWKDAIETYFQECIEFLFPVAAEGIDWNRGYTFLDKAVTASRSRCRIRAYTRI